MDNLNHCNTLLIQISVNDTTCIISKFFLDETGKMITISQLKLI